MGKVVDPDDAAYIKQPKHIPLFIRLGLAVSKRVTKKDLLAPRLLAWYPKVAFSSGVLEALVAHGKKDLNKRILKLVRIQCSISVACPFCIDMNSFEYGQSGITDEEMKALAEKKAPEQVASFTIREKLALEYAEAISQTPVYISDDLISRIKSAFTEREIVILSSTAAQVNYWARLLKSLGVPPAGFLDSCRIPSGKSDK